MFKRRPHLIILLSGLFLLLVTSCSLLLGEKDLQPKPQEVPTTVAKGVTLAGFPLGGSNRREVEELLGKLALLYDAPPVDARLDPVSQGVVPELKGRRLQREANLLAALHAREGARLTPFFEDVLPSKTLSAFPSAPIYQGNPARREASLCFNVAWGEENLPAILDLLEREGVKSTFFLQGSWIKKNPELAKRLASVHELGNHSLTHPHVTQLGEEALRREVQATQDLLRSLGGSNPPYFAPPYGEYNGTVLKIASAFGLRTILWTVDTVDWKRPGPDVIVRRVLDRLVPGAIILLHPTEQTGPALEKLIPAIRQRGFRLVPLSRLLSSELPGLEEASP